MARTAGGYRQAYVLQILIFSKIASIVSLFRLFAFAYIAPGLGCDGNG